MKLFGKNESPEQPTPQSIEDIEARTAIASLEQRIAQLEAHLAELEGKMSTIAADDYRQHITATPAAAAPSESYGATPVSGDSPSANPRHTPSAPRQLYLSAPTPEGIFTDYSDEERVGSSVYLLTTDDGINGTFRMLNTPDALATLAISISQFVKPVCKIIGAVSIQPRHVVVHMPGSAVFEDGVWRTTVKAQVQFE